MINKDLEDFIRLHLKYTGPLHEKTKLVQDLMINENKAFAFITKYADIFRVDISEFNIQEYFGYNSKKKSLTVGDLEKGVDLGLLNDNIINFNHNDQQLSPNFSLKNILLGALLLIIITGLLAFVAFYS